MHSHLYIHINGILLRTSVMRIGVLNCDKNVILELKGFIKILYVSPVYFHCDYSTYPCGFKAHAIFAYGICTDRQLAWKAYVV